MYCKTANFFFGGGSYHNFISVLSHMHLSIFFQVIVLNWGGLIVDPEPCRSISS